MKSRVLSIILSVSIAFCSMCFAWPAEAVEIDFDNGNDLHSVEISDTDILGLWYGTWQLDGIGWTSSFSMTFFESPSGLLAMMYVPELGLFDEYLPVLIDNSDIMIGIPGVVEIEGSINATSVSGSFYANYGGDPPLIYTGIWQAEKYTGQEFMPGEAPGLQCDDLPPLYCVGDAEYCSEIVLFSPAAGPGYLDYPQYPETNEDQYFSYLRRDLMYLIKYATAKTACKTSDWDYGNHAPLGLGDMSEADGSTPGTLFGDLRHPIGTHEDGKDIDTAYYQLYAVDNLLRPVGVHYDGYFEAYHLIEPPYALDKWRTALFIAYLSEHPHLRVIGVDGKIGPILEEALDALVEIGWLETELRESIPLVYEVEDTGMGWYYHHHGHMHISMNPVYDIVSAFELNPQTLNIKNKGNFVTAYIEFDEGYEVSQIDSNSTALILNGHNMLYAQPQDMEITDYNNNGIDDLTVKFCRQTMLELVDEGDIEISITGSLDGVYFQETDTIRIIGE